MWKNGNKVNPSSDFELETTADATYNITAVSGFAFLSDLPLIIKHELKVFPAAGTYTDWPANWERSFEGRGKLIIDASGETFTVVAAGPFTVNTAAGIGDAGPYGDPLSWLITASGAPGWAADAYANKFIRMLTGASAGYIYPIYYNGADTIQTLIDNQGIVNGDTFDIIDCPVIINTSYPISIKCNAASKDTWPYPGGIDADRAPESPFFFACGIKWRCEFTGAVTSNEYFSMNGVSGGLNFCKIVSDGASPVLFMKDSDINQQTVPASLFTSAVLSDETQFSLIVADNDEVPTAVTDYTPDYWYHTNDTVILESSYIGYSSIRGAIAVLGGGRRSSVMWSICQNISSFSSDMYIFNSFIDQKGFNDYAISIVGGSGEIYATYINKSGQPLFVGNRGSLKLTWLKGATISTDYALVIQDGSYVNVFVAADVTLVGAVGATSFPDTGAVNVAWPASDVQTDPAGSIVKNV